MRLTHKKLNEHYESELLEEFAVKYATRSSYEKVSELVLERSGSSRLSDQRIYQMVQEKAAESVIGQKEIIRQSEKRGLEIKAVEVDI